MSNDDRGGKESIIQECLDNDSMEDYISILKIEVHKRYKEEQLDKDLTKVLIKELTEIMVPIFKNKDISAVINKESGVKYDLHTIENDSEILDKCIFESHIWGLKGNANSKQAKNFFEIETTRQFSHIYTNETAIELMRKAKIRFNTKWTKNEHTVSIGFFTGIYTAGSSSKYYNDLIAEIIDVERDDIQVSRRTVYQRKYNSSVMNLKVILSMRDRTELLLWEKDLSKYGIKFISYRKNSASDQYTAMTTHNLMNPLYNSVTLIGVNVQDEVTFEGKTESLRSTLKNVRVDKKVLFYGAEQGIARKQNQIHVFYYKNNIAVAKKWLRRNVGPYLKFVYNENPTSDILKHVEEPTVVDEYSERLRAHLKYQVQDTINIPNYTK